MQAAHNFSKSVNPTRLESVYYLHCLPFDVGLLQGRVDREILVTFQQQLMRGQRAFYSMLDLRSNLLGDLTFPSFLLVKSFLKNNYL